jgi:hypothetical protein
MSIFGDILNKITGAVTGTGTAEAAPAGAATEATPSESHSPAAALSEVDIEKVLSSAADQRGGGGNWRSSIVDLLKLLDLPSSLEARKHLADELNVHAGEPGSAEENVALYQAVMQKLEENGGKVPDSMKH